jgi:prepilin-type N-terminal cleavage/methylation domain-containing protein
MTVSNRVKNHRSKRFLTGFTIVELLTVIAVIAILMAILIPALAMVRRIAKETQQRAQFTTLDLAILAFKGDRGDYPPSGPERDGTVFCSGAQKLAEALLGRDLLGFHSDSIFRGDGMNPNLTPPYDDLYPANLDPETDPVHRDNLGKRKGPYLDVATANAFRLGGANGLFVDTGMLDADAFVICDVFGIKNITLAKGQVVRAGTPILYYRANTSSKIMDWNRQDESIYNWKDNQPLLSLGRLPVPEARPPHSLFADDGRKFYNEGVEDYKIIDPRITTTKWPHRADSYILISAGADGEYGTNDDILNF